jgi:signal transduction histidine kinase
LAFSFRQLGWVGIAIFFLPLVLSAYAFRLYVSQMQAHMDNLENIVSESTDALKKALQEKDAFLAVLSHDMKTPLTTIRLYVKMLKDRPHVLAQKPQVVDTVLHSQEVLIDIVNNILDLEKLQTEGELPLKKETFDYVSVAQRVISLIQIQAESKNIELQLRGFEQNILVYADLKYMERILNNLLSNAIKYTPEEGNIDITLRQQKNELEITVNDSGYGIPSEDLPYVFDRFRRVASHQKLAAGTGLGLAITKALIEAHEGHIEVASKIEEGSCFIAHLPILIKQEPNQKKQQDKDTTTFISY